AFSEGRPCRRGVTVVHRHPGLPVVLCRRNRESGVAGVAKRGGGAQDSRHPDLRIAPVCLSCEWSRRRLPCSFVVRDAVRVRISASTRVWKTGLRRIRCSRRHVPLSQCREHGTQYFRLGFPRDLSGDAILRNQRQVIILRKMGGGVKWKWLT